MEQVQRVCAVCKQPIPDGLAIPLDGGTKFAHYGHCYDHAKSIPVTENQTDVLTETELLL